MVNMRVVVCTPKWSLLEYSLALLVAALVAVLLAILAVGLSGLLVVARVCRDFASAAGAGACVEATSFCIRLSLVAEMLAALDRSVWASIIICFRQRYQARCSLCFLVRASVRMSNCMHRRPDSVDQAAVVKPVGPAEGFPAATLSLLVLLLVTCVVCFRCEV